MLDLQKVVQDFPVERELELSGSEIDDLHEMEQLLEDYNDTREIDLDQMLACVIRIKEMVESRI